MTTPNEDVIREALRSVLDPEIGVNIVDLGLVYEIATADGAVDVTLGVTSPTCPLGPHLAETSRAAVEAVAPGVTVSVQIARDPPWSPERMSDAARAQLGW